MPLAFTQSATPVSLRRLFASASFVGCGDIAVSDVTADSRACRPGSLFAAFPGTVADGVDFIDEAIGRGATAVLLERPLTTARVPQCIVPDVRRAFAGICDALYGYPSRRLGIVGVTGTNGKTTVTWLVRSILEAAGWPTALLGTIEYSDGIESEPATLTTPCAKTISRWLATAAARATQYAAIELSSHALDQSRAASTLLDVAIVTNITHDHFDYHGNFEAYRASKARILDQLKRRGLVVLNADDPGSADIAAHTSNGTQVKTYGLDRDAHVTAEQIQLTPRGSMFRLRTSVNAVDVRTHLIGRHNVANCLAAAVAAMHVGVSVNEIAEGIEALEFVPGRMERVESDRPFQVYVDYAHTEDALRRAVAAVREVTDGRVLCVFGAGGNRDRSKRPLLGRAAGEADVAVVTTDNPRHEHPHQIIDEILKGCREAAVAIHVEPNRAEAIRWAIAQAESGDAVLVAGKGHETVQVVGDERRPFDDRRVCLAALGELASAHTAAAVS
jgi:UDP-N-acetylmuramoyl-L-alanyl-D-glutamate--2,6-diaminopimelate ligase